jgi:sterol 3beta-glucosyltransferase
MRITILAIGSEGDVRYILALGKGLVDAGYTIRFATHSIFEKMVRSLGFEFSLLKANPGEMLNSEAGQTALKKGKVKDFFELIKPAVLQTGNECWGACQGTDAILYSPVAGYFGPDIGEVLDVPALGAYCLPMDPTRAFPSLFVSQRSLGGVINQLTYTIYDGMSWLPLRSTLNLWRRDPLNLPPRGILACLMASRQRTPVLYAFSRYVVPKPPDWGDNLNITGYWFLDESASWQPPQQLADFLAAGPPPVYIGFGSMSDRKPEETTNLVLRALAQSKQRGILATGWGGLGQQDLPGEVFKIDRAPHDWLFPRVAAAVHHGGAGTTAASLRAGIPCVIIPHFMDQPYWGQRVVDLGVGPQFIPRDQLTEERLTSAILEALGNQSMRQSAVTLGDQIRAEDGVGQAVKVLDRYLSKSHKVSTPVE